MKTPLACALALAGLLASSTSPVFASVASDARTLLPAARTLDDPWTQGLAEGWLEIAQRQDSQVLISKTYNDAAPKALQNARHFIDGSVPFAPIYGEKHWPTRETWVKALRAIEATNEHAATSACKGEKAGQLAALTDEVWKEQDETHGTRWVHGWAQIERAKQLADEVDVELASCAPKTEARVQTAAQPGKPQTIALSADALFDFNSAVLTKEGQAQVGRLAQSIVTALKDRLTPEDGKVTVSGYTDRLGKPAYNQALSRRRAAAVAQVLQTQGVPRDVVDIQGLGSASPVKRCAGPASPSVIACLSPNRRVEIRVSARLAG